MNMNRWYIKHVQNHLHMRQGSTAVFVYQYVFPASRSLGLNSSFKLSIYTMYFHRTEKLVHVSMAESANFKFHSQYAVRDVILTGRSLRSLVDMFKYQSSL